MVKTIIVLFNFKINIQNIKKKENYYDLTLTNIFFVSSRNKIYSHSRYNNVNVHVFYPIMIMCLSNKINLFNGSLD